MLKKLLIQSDKYLACGLAVLLGVVLSLFLLIVPFNYFKLTISPQLSFQIDLMGVLSLLVTTGLAVYVLRVLNRSDDSDKVERDLLIKYFTDFESRFSEDIHRMTATGGVEGSDVAATFQKNGMFLQELLELAKSHASSSKNETNLVALEQGVSEISELLSNVPQEGVVEDGVRLEGNIISYSPRYIGVITASMGKFKKSIFSVIVGINRY